MDVSVSLDEVLAVWPKGQDGLRQFFVEIAEEAQGKPGAETQCFFRPGVSYSYRAALTVPRPGRSRPVFFLADVIISQEEPWFLSVCFYKDEISDPEELGNAIPLGLFDETGYCFDVDEYDLELCSYLKNRLAEAYCAAGGEV